MLLFFTERQIHDREMDRIKERIQVFLTPREHTDLQSEILNIVAGPIYVYTITSPQIRRADCCSLQIAPDRTCKLVYVYVHICIGVYIHIDIYIYICIYIYI